MEYPFKENFKITPHFSLMEFTCRRNFGPCPVCGGAIRPRDLPSIWETAPKLEKVRKNLADREGEEVEILITRAGQCWPHNALVTSVWPPDKSDHWLRFAVDMVARAKIDKMHLPDVIVAEECKKVFGEEYVVEEKDHTHIKIL